MKIIDKRLLEALCEQAEALAGALDCAAGWIGVADQDTGIGWRSLA